MKGIFTIFSLIVLMQAASGQVVNPAPYTNTKVSYVRTWDAMMPWQNSDSLVNRPVQDVKQITQYLDGLGRPLQTVVKQASPSQKDMIDGVTTYDPFGREQYKYLPFASNVVQAGDITNDGDFKFTPYRQDSVFSKNQYPGEVFFYNQTNYEASPLNRPSASYAPGGSWVGSSRGISTQYLNNASTDSVQEWNIKFPAGSIPVTAGAYPAGKLEKTISTDENNHQVIEYKDLTGHTVLKKVQLAAAPGTAHVGWLNTYYVYDSLENLRFVISPRAVELINTTANNWVISQGIADELCFRYEYDYRNRMSVKKIPGAGETWMVYDSRDRVVLTEDANLRTTHQWLFVKYDALNRAVMTGLYTDNTNIAQSTMQSYLTAQGSGLYETYSGGSFPGYSLTGSFPSVASTAVLTVTYYDDYAWVTATGTSLTGTLDVSGSSKFLTASNTTFPYPRAVAQNNQTYGLVTGSISKIIGSASQYIYSAMFYDDHSRIIQTQSINYTGGKDISTTQYDFSGKPIRTLLQHQKNGNNAQSHTILTKTDYDHASRIKHIWKNIDNAATDQLIDSLQYNELSQMRAKYVGNNIDSLVYDYNIRGWLTGINKNFVASTSGHYFGMELGYDKSTSVAPGNTYATQEFNGNIEGTVWKSMGDGINRKYDFLYDNVNRFTGAKFLQNTTGSAWDSTTVNFGVNNMSYDANGNILSMNQEGFTVGGSAYIDKLTYTYQTNSNKLSKVDDAQNDPNSKLGDFHYTGTKQPTDYSYDGNGNLNVDNNKAISSIVYNYLNLPQTLTVTAKGNITYTYDAGGNKLVKTTVDNTTTPSKTTTTLYLGGIIYQNDTLQFIGHEEGRVRWALHHYLNGSSAYGFEYDHFLKDHLGNTRMVLTQEKDTSKYMATMESAYRATENQLFYNIPQSSYPRALVAGYPTDNTTVPNDSLAKVNGSGQKIGPSIILKVMAGDNIDIAAKSYWVANGNPLTNSSLTDALTSLANGIIGLTNGSKGTLSQLNTTGSPLYNALNSFIFNNETSIPNKPKAYLNWILLDEQFNYVNTYPQSGAIPISNFTAGTLGTPGYSGIPITKSGYLYIYVSNESQNWDVFFDNLTVQHRTGPITEETHYYPFGLTMAGISSKSAGGLQNKEKTFQGQRFDDDLGLNWIQFKWRNHDPQIGRFIEIDPLSEKYVYNSTYAFSENKVTSHTELEGLEAIPLSGASQLWQQAQQAATSSGPYAEPILVGGAIAAGLYALFELVADNPPAPGTGSMTLIPAEMQNPAKAFTEDKTKSVPNPNGKKGGEEHQNTIKQEEKRLKEQGFDKTEREVKVETPNGKKEKRYVDLKGTNTQTGASEEVQVGKQNKNGTPVSREKSALDDIEKATGTRPTFVPYNPPAPPPDIPNCPFPIKF